MQDGAHAHVAASAQLLIIYYAINNILWGVTLESGGRVRGPMDIGGPSTPDS